MVNSNVPYLSSTIARSDKGDVNFVRMAVVRVMFAMWLLLPKLVDAAAKNYKAPTKCVVATY